MLTAGLLIAAGLALLAFAPERFVAGSAGLADQWGLSRVVIGAVVIGFGTSAPELLVSGIAAGQGNPEVGVGNIVGSNMANLGLVLAVAALVGQVTCPWGLIRRELPFMLGGTVAFAVLVQNGLSRPEGLLLGLGLVAVIGVLLLPMRSTRRTRNGRFEAEVKEFVTREEARGQRRVVLDTVVGLLGTLVGAQLLVTGAVDVAAELNLSAGFVGMTIVALGTSLPELVTGVVAVRSGEDQLILGNIVGSNLFNSLGVAAVVALVGPGPLDDAALTVGGVGLMLGLTALAAAAMVRNRDVSRVEAAGLLAAYLAVMPFLAI